MLVNEYNADINIESTGGTPLCIAVSHGTISMVEWLLENGTDINRAADGVAPLHASVHDSKMVSFLLERDAAIEIRPKPDQHRFIKLPGDSAPLCAFF